MALVVAHRFVSALPDVDDATLVRPSNWNDTHVITGTLDLSQLSQNGATASQIIAWSGSAWVPTSLLPDFGTQVKNTIFSGPASGVNATPTFRALVGADLPNPSATTLGGIQSAAAQTSKWINSISTSGVPSLTQPAFSDISGTAAATQGGTGIATYTTGDTLYASATNTLSKLAGNTTTTRKFLRQTGNGTISAAPAWDTIVAADIPGSALTKTDDTNVTLTLGGSPTTALLNAASITVGWTGTLAAARLNSNVVQSIVNDTNVTGVISAQVLTLGWTGTQSVARGGTGAGTLTAHAVLLGEGTSTLGFATIGTGGRLLLDQGSGADPLFQAMSGDATIAASGAFTIKPTLNVFLIGGQSNANGQGVSGQSPNVPTGRVLQYAADGTILDANDPVKSAVNAGQDANTGSAWPSFGLTYFNATGGRVLFVQAAIGGTSQVAAAGGVAGNWDASGALFAQSITVLNAAITAAAAAGYNPVVRGVLWDQGERDAIAINATTITQADYITALTAMIARYRAATINGTTYPSLPFYIFQTGTDTAASDVGYAAVRAGQQQVKAADNLTQIVFRDAIDFNALGYLQASPNEIHYTQPGYNMMGRVGAANVLAAQALNGFQPSGTGTDIYHSAGNVSLGYTTASASGVRFTVNNNSVVLPAPLSTATVEQVSSSDTAGSTSELLGTGGQSVLGLRSALGTMAAPTKLTSGSNIGSVNAFGYDAVSGWSTTPAAGVAFRAAEDWNDATHHGSRIALRTTTNATATPTDRFFVENDGGFISPSVTGGSKGAGTINISGLTYSAGNAVATSATSPLSLNATTGLLTLALTNTHILVGNSSNLAADVAMSGDATIANTGAITLASVITAGGPTGSATVAPIVTWDAKGRLTAVSSATITPAVGSITGLATGIATWLATPSSANLAAAVTDETGSGLLVFGTAPTIAGGSITALTTFTLRDISAAFDVTLAATSTSATLTAGRTVTLDVGNVAHTIKLGTTANTITFPSAASYNVLTDANLVTLAQGGTNANLTASNGGIFYSTASAAAILSGTATANLPLLSGASSAPTWATVSHPTSATSGGVAYFSSTTVMASSALLAANQIVLGGGAGTAPATLGSLGTTTTVLHGNASGVPSFAAVSLTADVSGILPGANGGTANGFFAVSGPATSLKTFTFPNASATVLTDNAAVTLAQGGTNANLTASNGGIFYSTASAGAILAGTSTARQMLQSGASTTPAWSTTTWPATATVNRLLWVSATNVISDLATANSSVLVTDGSGVPSLSTTLPNIALGTPTSVTLTNGTGLPISSGVSGLGTGVATALAVNTGSAGAFVVNGGALGSPSSAGTIPAFTLGGTIAGGGNQINNVVIGTTTPLAGSFTTVSGSTSITSPLHIGGSGTTGTQLTFKTTTGNGTTESYLFTGGNNGGTTFGAWNATGFGINTTAANIDTALKINLNAATPPATPSAGAHLVALDAAGTGYSVDTFAAAANNTFRRANGTNASPSALSAGDVIGALVFDGYANGAYTGIKAGIRFIAGANNWISTDNGTKINFLATPLASTTVATGVTMWGSSGLSVGTTAVGTDPGSGGLYSDGANVYFSGVGTTASAANAFLNNASTPANQLLRSTSSLRYKRDVEDLDPSAASVVLLLRPIWYRSKASSDNQSWSWYGLAAEDVAEADPRLVHWAYPEEDWESVEEPVIEDGEEVIYKHRRLKATAKLVPDGVMYDRVGVLTLAVVQQQEKRIAFLEQRLAELT